MTGNFLEEQSVNVTSIVLKRTMAQYWSVHCTAMFRILQAELSLWLGIFALKMPQIFILWFKEITLDIAKRRSNFRVNSLRKFGQTKNEIHAFHSHYFCTILNLSDQVECCDTHLPWNHSFNTSSTAARLNCATRNQYFCLLFKFFNTTVTSDSSCYCLQPSTTSVQGQGQNHRGQWKSAQLFDRQSEEHSSITSVREERSHNQVTIKTFGSTDERLELVEVAVLRIELKGEPNLS